ncbi:MAG: Hpt domain-containing protein [Magnetococcus sp. DMHC-8]
MKPVAADGQPAQGLAMAPTPPPGIQPVDDSHHAQERHAAVSAIRAQALAQLQTATGAGFGRLLALFLKNLPGRLETLTNAWQADDLATLQQTAHQLKGIVAAYGAEELARRCAVLEHSLLQGNGTADMPAMLAAIHTESDRVRQALQHFLTG